MLLSPTIIGVACEILPAVKSGLEWLWNRRDTVRNAVTEASRLHNDVGAARALCHKVIPDVDTVFGGQISTSGLQKAHVAIFKKIHSEYELAQLAIWSLDINEFDLACAEGCIMDLLNYTLVDMGELYSAVQENKDCTLEEARQLCLERFLEQLDTPIRTLHLKWRKEATNELYRHVEHMRAEFTDAIQLAQADKPCLADPNRRAVIELSPAPKRPEYEYFEPARKPPTLLGELEQRKPIPMATDVTSVAAANTVQRALNPFAR